MDYNQSVTPLHELINNGRYRTRTYDLLRVEQDHGFSNYLSIKHLRFVK